MSTPLADVLEPLDLRDAFRGAAASTWVVTGSSTAGHVGFTAISIVSVSVDPPLVSFNISKTSSSLAPISRSRTAALHLLSDEQRSVASRFASDRDRRFIDDGTWSLDGGGLPQVHGVAARLVTHLVDLVDVGDSFIAVARVDTADITDRRPLVHHAGGYYPLTTLTTTPNGA